MQDSETRLARIEKKISELEAVYRVRRHILQLNISSALLKAAPGCHYYEWSLSERANYLGCGVEQLCKSIIVKNTAFDKASADAISCTSRYYCIVMQYQSKLNTEEFMRFIRGLCPGEKQFPRRFFNFQHAPAQECAELTGFEHNGLSPFGMRHLMPIVIAKEIADLNANCIWLGGGASNYKLRIGVSHLIQALSASVADNISNLRTE